MFGELPKLFDRNFAIGFFLPVAIFLALSAVVLSQYGFASNVITYLTADLLIGITILGLLSWVGGIFLLALNRELYRMIEGYGKYNPIRVFSAFEKVRYKKTLDELGDLDEEFRKCIGEKKEFPAKSRIRRNKLMRKLAEEFPDKEEYLLATAFGNVLRSFETYPRVMYGLEGIDGWGRLLAVIPKDYLELVGAAKAQVDFWINIGFVIALLQIEYIGLAYMFGNQLNWWIVSVLTVLELIATLRTTSSAREWGAYVKSAFDMFIPKMREALGLVIPTDQDDERKQWTSFSQAIIYRIPERIPELKKQESHKIVKAGGHANKAPNKG